MQFRIRRSPMGNHSLEAWKGIWMGWSYVGHVSTYDGQPSLNSAYDQARNYAAVKGKYVTVLKFECDGIAVSNATPVTA